MDFIKSYYFNTIINKMFPLYADYFAKLNRLDYLKITDDREHQKLSGKISFFWNLSISCLCTMMFIILSQIIETVEELNFIIGAIFTFLFLTLMYSSVVQIIFSLLESHYGNKIISKSLFLQIFVVLSLGTGAIFVGDNGVEKKLSKFFDKELTVSLSELGNFWVIILLVLIAIIFIFINYVFNLTVIEVEKVNKSNSIFTGIVAIVGIIWGINFEPQPGSNVIAIKFISFLVFLATITTNVLPSIISWRCKKSYEKAEEIFQKQLMKSSSQINYDELKSCYYYGGEKYKDKMLSNEKMLRKIRRMEK